MASGKFTPAEGGLIATAAAIVFTRVFAFSLTMIGFTEFARTLVPAGTSGQNASLLAGIALGAYGITMALAQLGTGILSDRIGRRPVLLGGTALFVLGAIICAFATNIWILIAARLLQGLGGVSSAAMAAVGETVPEERRTTAMALIGIPAGLGVFLGFMIGPVLAPLIGFAGIFWITAALGLCASLPLLGRPLPQPHAGTAHPRRSLGLPVLALAISGFTINFAMMAVMTDFETGVLARIGNATLGFCLLAAFVVMGLVSRAVDRNRAAWLPIAAALVFLAAAAPAFRLAPTYWIVALAGTGFFAAHAVLSAILPSQVSRLAGRSGGLGHGIQLVVAYMGSATGAIVAGLVAGHIERAFWVLGAVAALACALVLTGARLQKSEVVAVTE